MSSDKDESSRKAPPRHRLPRPEKQLTCGCCTDGCVCHQHQDIRRGILARACDYHASLPRAPLDPAFRYDSSLGDFTRVPRGPDVDLAPRKCARRGCHHSRVEGSEFCGLCSLLAGPDTTCDDLTAVPEPTPEPPPSEDTCPCGTLLEVQATVSSAEIYCSQIMPGDLRAYVKLVLQYSSPNQVHRPIVGPRALFLRTHLLGRLMQVTGVPKWSDVAGQAVRVHLSREGTLLAIGHSLEDVWINLTDATVLWGTSSGAPAATDLPRRGET